MAKTRVTSFDLQAENQELKDRIQSLEKEMREHLKNSEIQMQFRKSQTPKKSNTRVTTDLVTPRGEKIFNKPSTALNFENDEPPPILDRPVDKREEVQEEVKEEFKEEEEPLAGMVSPQVQESDLLDSQSFSFMDSE